MSTERPQPPADSPAILARLQGSLDVVEHCARQLHRQLGGRVELNDLRSAGREGLLQAARQFDPALGVPFRRWANLRVRGAMLDHARGQSGLPRRVYQTLRALQAAREISAAHADAQKAPSAQHAEQLLQERLAQAATAMALGFLSARPLDEALVADDAESAEQLLATAQRRARLRAAIEQLPRAERTLLSRHYFDDWTLEQAGRELGLSKSWASRLHARALSALRQQLCEMP